MEIRDSRNNVVRSGTLSHAEFQCLPLLDDARTALAAGDPQAAIARLVEAIRATQGEDAILPALDRARALAQAQRDAAGGCSAAAALASMRAAGLATGREAGANHGGCVVEPVLWPSSARSIGGDPCLSPIDQPQAAQAAAVLPSAPHSTPLLSNPCSNNDVSLLSTHGRADLLANALADGETVCCDACGAHVPPARMTAHIAHWCRVLHPVSDGEDAAMS